MNEMRRPDLWNCDVMRHRRELLKIACAGIAGTAVSHWAPARAGAGPQASTRRRAVILLWMGGGPSQLETFDLKTDHENGGGAKSIETSVPGIRIDQHLPGLAKQAHRLAIFRSMITKEGDHSRGTYLMRTGYSPQGPIRYPSIGALYAKELAGTEGDLPNFISVAPDRFVSSDAYGPGFLGAAYAPLVVGEAGRRGPQDGADRKAFSIDNISRPETIGATRHDARLALMECIGEDFRHTRPDVAVLSHQTAYEKALRMMGSRSIEAFDLEQEPASLRQRYGMHMFGQGCLLARRLIECGASFVEVSLNRTDAQNGLDWDTHSDNATRVRRLNEILDPAWSTLMTDLDDRGLLATTTILWMGEFGRTPKINANAGRDHAPNAWTTVLAGGGIRGGQLVGRTSEDGMEISDRPVSVQDLLATAVAAIGIDPKKQNISNVGRPIRIVDPNAQAVLEALA
jgi:hypothetical protein